MKKMLELQETMDRLTYDMLHESDPERSAELREELISTLGAIEDKAAAYLHVMDRHDIEIEAAKSYAEGHMKRAKRMESQREFMKNVLMGVMQRRYEQHGELEMRAPGGRWIKFNPAKRGDTLVINEDELPEDWFRVSRSPRKADIRAALKEGKEMPGVVREEKTTTAITWGKR